MDKLKMHTKSKVDINIESIGALFPNTVTETIKGYDENNNAIIEKAIDFDILKQELSKVIVEGREERYQMNWPGKKESILTANTPINKTLRPCREDSVNFDETENLYIEGDNLEVLKLLQETYLNRVKMIYIDPPYNTGNDSFVYNDNFQISNEQFSEASGQYDEDGNLNYDIRKNNESNGRFHTDWLNMMYPRLKLAKNLLRDDGVIFISIDDNEISNLKKICEEIFGSVNYVGDFVKQSKVGGGSDSKYIAKEHENVMVFCKNINNLPEMFEEHDKEYLKRYKEEDNKGKYFWDTFARNGLKNPINYDIIAPDGTIINGNWIRSKARFKEEYEDGTIRIIKKQDGNWSVQFKQYLNCNGKKPRSMTTDFGGTIEGKKEIEYIFSNDKIFTYPKSTVFLNKLMKFVSVNGKDIVLDFFSGSATTAHAVMKLNAEDGGKRKFIMVQLPEETDNKSEARKSGYENICEIGKERIRRAGKKIIDENPEVADKLDIGFRVLKLDSSNMKDVYYNPNEYTQDMLSHLESNIKDDRTSEDLLFQVMLDLGELLSSDIRVIGIEGKKVFNVGDGNIVACFDDEITNEVLTEIAKMKPLYAVFRDSSLSNDSVVTNFEQIFKTYSPNTIRKVL
ncbi:MAG: site-specific DNA-methyltransferase [Clostridium paraputrificum]